MKFLNLWLLAVVIICFGCNTPDSSNHTSTDSTTQNNQIKKEASGVLIPKTFSNERFKNVVVSKITEDSFSISGKARVFEAVFNWTLKEGDKEIKTGYKMTDAGAPEWGNFVFGITVPAGTDSTLRLVLFESSAKDGSRVSELTLPLKQAL
ncbi:MAG: Gmad2 immunoglobulin-like domain-containing protein [Ginsengibacter sp.]